MQPIATTIAGRTATLTASNRAKFEFQASGGKISALFDADQSYLHSIRLMHACLDAETRKLYPEPVDLCDHIAPEDPEAFIPAFQAANAAGWFPSVDELQPDCWDRSWHHVCNLHAGR